MSRDADQSYEPNTTKNGRINAKRTVVEEILEVLGTRIRELRENRGISQEDFAMFCGLHRTAVGLLERGKSIPRLDTLLIVSEGLGLSVSKLLRGIERWGRVSKEV